jgi:hypothetical protein
VRNRVGGRQSSVSFGRPHVFRGDRAVVLRRPGRRTARGCGVREDGQVGRRGHARSGQRPTGTKRRTHLLPLKGEIGRAP